MSRKISYPSLGPPLQWEFTSRISIAGSGRDAGVLDGTLVEVGTSVDSTLSIVYVGEGGDVRDGVI